MKKNSLENLLELRNHQLKRSKLKTAEMTKKIEEYSQELLLSAFYAEYFFELAKIPLDRIKNSSVALDSSILSDYVCVDTNEISDLAVAKIGHWLKSRELESLDDFEHLNLSHWHIILKSVQAYYVSTLLSSNWVWPNEMPLYLRSISNMSSSYKGLLFEMSKDYEILTHILNLIESNFPDKTQHTEVVEKCADELFLSQIRFADDINQNLVLWYDGLAWHKQKTKHRNEWALFVMEEQLFAVIKNATKLSHDKIVLLISSFRKSFVGKNLTLEAFKQRRTRLKAHKRVTAQVNLLLIHKED